MASAASLSRQTVYSYEILRKFVSHHLNTSFYNVYKYRVLINRYIYARSFFFSWRCCYYTYSFFYGLIVLWDKPWLWDINYCYYNYPYHSVTSGVWWYYMISMAFYWALSFSQFFDVKRKDFWQMFVHHIATILLMCFSWAVNLTRVGTLVLLLHDSADILLEVKLLEEASDYGFLSFRFIFIVNLQAAKMAKYANYQKVCDCIFTVFTILWIVTRIIVFPAWILWRYVLIIFRF